MGCKDIEDSVSLATELLIEVKKQAHRWFVAFMICLFLLFASNMVWLYFWNTYDYATVNSEDGGNANYIGNDGDIVNGNNQGQKEEE